MDVALLSEIQSALVSDTAPIAPILLKLRLLASKLGSHQLEDWVKHEIEGYPEDADLPSYRVLGVSYVASFSGPFGSGIQNAPVPSYAIRSLANASWVDFEFRQSAAAIDDLLKSVPDTQGVLHMHAGDLIPILQGKIYPGYACNSVTGQVSRATLAEVKHCVRSRMLELVIGLEKSVPYASNIAIGGGQASELLDEGKQVTNIYNQVVHGNAGILGSAQQSVSSVGDNVVQSVSIGKGDINGLKEALISGGITEDDASELVDIIGAEQPEGADLPLGKRAQEWLSENLKKAATGVWKVGVSVATNLISAAAARYYGLN